MNFIPHVIDGQETESASGARFASVDPWTREPYAEVALGGPEDADRAVQAFGGRGYLRSNVAERFNRELRVDRIWEGTSEVQRLIIARALERDAEFDTLGHTAWSRVERGIGECGGNARNLCFGDSHSRHDVGQRLFRGAARRTGLGTHFLSALSAPMLAHSA